MLLLLLISTNRGINLICLDQLVLIQIILTCFLNPLLIAEIKQMEEEEEPVK